MAVRGLLSVSSVTRLPHLSLSVVAHRCPVSCLPFGFVPHVARSPFGFPDVVLHSSLSLLWSRGEGGYFLAWWKAFVMKTNLFLSIRKNLRFQLVWNWCGYEIAESSALLAVPVAGSIFTIILNIKYFLCFSKRLFHKSCVLWVRLFFWKAATTF